MRAETTEGRYSSVQLKQARLVGSLLYGTRTKLVMLDFPAFEKKNRRLMTVSVDTLRMTKF